MKRVCYIAAITVLFLGCGSQNRTSFGPTQSTGGARTAVSTPGQAQGVYRGTYSFPLSFYAIVLPDDRFYAFDSRETADGSVVQPWVVRIGQGSSADGSYHAALTHYFAPGDGPLATTLTGTYVPHSTLSGSVTFQSNGGSHTLNAAVLPSTQLDFNTPATLANLVGSWQAWGICDMLVGGPEGGCEPFNVTVNTSGEIRMTDLGCTWAILVPDPARNFFTATIPVGPGTCFPNLTKAGSGMAVEMLLSDGVTRQFLLAASGDNNVAFVMAAQR